MKNHVIEVEGIGKRYRISQTASNKSSATYGTLQESIVKLAKSPIKRAVALLKGDAYGATGLTRDFWALSDISFDVEQGDIVGIVGRNGAGKTTLLKILSKITDPTRGVAKLKGKVAALLEVGTGFHPELTGRENVFLNGAILGMRKSEIDSKFDEIIAFAEVETFVDTPVKFFSTGMQVRLAFAVAAHLEPEILIIDEVLAVGDIEFQRRCIGKMEELGTSGRTVLFVSHNMPAVSRLCTRAILLDEGKIVIDGSVTEVVSQYVGGGHKLASKVWAEDERNPGDDWIQLRSIRAVNAQLETDDPFDIRHPIGIEITYELLKGDVWFSAGFNVTNSEGQLLFNTAESPSPDWESDLRPAGKYKALTWIPGNFLAEGLHFVNFTFYGFHQKPIKKGTVSGAIAFNVVDTLEGGSVRGKHTGFYPGLVRPLLRWETEKIEA